MSGGQINPITEYLSEEVSPTQLSPLVAVNATMVFNKFISVDLKDLNSVHDISEFTDSS